MPDPPERQLRGRSAIVPPKPDPTFAEVGRMMIGGGVFTAMGSVVVRDDPTTFGALIGASLLMLSWGTMFSGAPFTDDGKPSVRRIASLFVAGVAGLALQFLSSAFVALGIAQVSFAILVLAGVRWPPGEGERTGEDRTGIEPALAVPAAATLLIFLAVTGAAVQAIESTLALLAVIAIALVLLVRSWRRLMATYREAALNAETPP